MASPANEVANVTQSFSNWIKQPFNSNMSAGGWFLFFGLIGAISVAWALILKDLKGDF
jgi:hypothetical protein